MKRIDFENGSVTKNIFSAAIPMLVAQILNLLYNIVDRIYIARIPDDERYLPYAEYAKKPEGHFTMSQGDIVIYGECTEEITGVSGQTAAQILNHYKPNAFKVTASADNTKFPVAKHYRLGG